MSERLPSCPKHLSKEAAKWWREINRGWHLDAAALLLLQTGLEAFDRMRAAQAEIAEHGVVLVDRFAQRKSNPATVVERDCRTAVLAAFGKLNLDLEPLKLGGNDNANQ